MAGANGSCSFSEIVAWKRGLFLSAGHEQTYFKAYATRPYRRRNAFAAGYHPAVYTTLTDEQMNYMVATLKRLTGGGMKVLVTGGAGIWDPYWSRVIDARTFGAGRGHRVFRAGTSAELAASVQLIREDLRRIATDLNFRTNFSRIATA